MCMSVNDKPKTTLTGKIYASDIAIECYHLENDKRVISGTGLQKALGFLQRNTSGDKLKKILLSNKNREIFAAKYDELKANFEASKILFISPTTRRGIIPYATGYEATFLMDICHFIQDMYLNNLLDEKYHILYERATIISRAFAKVGIIALIDAATGYEKIRPQDALQKILDAYLSKNLSAWAKRFPDEFYKEIFRLNGWVYDPMSVKRPSCVANWTTNIVYDRLAPGIVEELEKKNPTNDKGIRKHKHHQFLTNDIGHPALAQHLYAVIGLMRTQQTWENFKRLLNRAYPVKTITDLFGEIE